MISKRQSNIELLRILAMFMILVIHANMISLPKPLSSDLALNLLSTTTRYFIESLGIVGVNVFVMISGWFLIRTRLKSVLSFLFQIIVLWGGGFIIFLILGKTELSLSNIQEIFFFTRWDWFIKAYIVLMIIAPVLNTYLENVSEKQMRIVILGFFIFSSTYGWIGGAQRFFVYGYGPLLFIGLYLLAHYAQRISYGMETPQRIKKIFSFNKYKDLLVYLICVLTNTVLGLLGLHYGKNIYNIVYAYINPFTIIGALHLLLFFSKLKIAYNKIINFLAAGSFAVFLIHSQVDIRPIFTKGVLYIYEANDTFLCLISMFFYLLIVYFISTILDLPRKWVWNKICQKFDLK